MEPNIDIQTEHRQDCAALLNKLLADEYLLYTKTLNYHWNVYGVHFDALHAFFQRLYEQQLSFVDEVAERVRALGEFSFGTMQEFLNNTQLQEEPTNVPDDLGMIKNLLNDHETIIRSIRVGQKVAMDTYNDAGTNNFLCELIEKHEKIAWMLRAFLTGKSSR